MHVFCITRKAKFSSYQEVLKLHEIYVNLRFCDVTTLVVLVS